MEKIKFSIITPCYNSSQTLSRTYESLKSLNKTSNFEWILVDDKSNDNGKTIKLIKEIKDNAPFDVKFILLDKNYFGSKSVYEGALISSGQYVCILDHDDCLLPNALDIIETYVEKYSTNKLIAGIVGRCINEKGLLIGEKFNSHHFISTEGDLRFKMHFTHELIQFTKKDFIINNFNNLKPGYTNGYAWAKISLTHKWVYINDSLRIYDTALPSSFSNSFKKTITFPENRYEAIQETLEFYNSHLLFNPLYSMRLAGSSIRYRLHSKKPLLSDLPKRKRARLFYFLSIIPGFIKYIQNSK